MKVYVTGIFRKDEKTLVTVSNWLGSIKGVWHFREGPVKDGTYMIELSFNGNADMQSSDIIKTEDTLASFSTDGITDTFTAECENIEEDGLVYLRFGADGLELLSVEENSNIKAGDMLRFTLPCEKVGIYPY